MDKKAVEEGEKSKHFLISPLHCTKCKMRNEKEKLFSRYLHRKKSFRLRLFASHIKFIFFHEILRFLAAFSVVIGWKLMDFRVIHRRSTTDMQKSRVRP
jgi:hypothetical protein